jgi:signal transduction histidine kinase
LQSLDQLEDLLAEFKSSQAAVDTQVRPVEIDVCGVLTRECDAIGAVAAAKGVALNVVRCPAKAGQSGHFFGDPARIGQIVSNVLLNAIRYTPQGGSVRVDCSHHDGQLEISIADSGSGVAAGSGYRLAIAKEFVEAQGGTIVAAKPAPEGARFVVRLPGTSTAAPGKAETD